MKKLFGLVAIGGLILIATPAPQAQAASLINPVISSSIAVDAAQSGVTEVRWHRWHWHRWHHRRW